MALKIDIGRTQHSKELISDEKNGDLDHSRRNPSIHGLNDGSAATVMRGNGGRRRNRTADRGFAVPCITTLLPGQARNLSMQSMAVNVMQPEHTLLRISAGRLLE